MFTIKSENHQLLLIYRYLIISINDEELIPNISNVATFASSMLWLVSHYHIDWVRDSTNKFNNLTTICWN